MKQVVIGGRTIVTEGDKSENCLIQPIDEHEFSLLPQELAYIKEHTHKDFMYVGLKIDDWNGELSPWAAPPVFGKNAFSGNAPQTLDYILGTLLPHLKQEYPIEEGKLILGGYSLAGFFALWASTQTSTFSGIVGASPSVWFPKWNQFAKQHPTQAKDVYLSLGDKEAKVKNQIMATVADNIDNLHQLWSKQTGEVHCQLTWNEGNHFKDPEIRTAKGFATLLNAE